MELDALNDVVPEIRDAGASFVTISPQLPQRSRALIKKHGLDHDILTDRGNLVAREYGLVWALPNDLREVYLGLGIDLEKSNGDDSWTLPMPARYIIDPMSVIRYARVNANYTYRPEPAETVEALKSL